MNDENHVSLNHHIAAITFCSLNSKISRLMECDVQNYRFRYKLLGSIECVMPLNKHLLAHSPVMKPKNPNKIREKLNCHLFTVSELDGRF